MAPPETGAGAAGAGQSEETPTRVETVEGRVSFVVNGQPRTFSYLPADHNYYLQVSSSFRAYPEAGATEQFGLTFLSLDLKQFSYPAELPPPREPGKPMDMRMAMASVGFIYVDENGMEWAGPASVTIESFDENGTLLGSFGEVRLPQVDDQSPDIVLSEGQFSVGLR
jgi:hypothetical protein